MVAAGALTLLNKAAIACSETYNNKKRSYVRYNAYLKPTSKQQAFLLDLVAEELDNSTPESAGYPRFRFSAAALRHVWCPVKHFFRRV
jgi:hypothetical protein